jgi:glutamate formiminotransferase
MIPVMIECVPNFSEGRDPHTIAALARVIGHLNGTAVLGFESDADHHRSVVTFAGEPEAVLEAAVRATGKAAELIDLRQHSGVHPRVGAADVVPFVPLDGSTLEECVAIAHRAGEEIWQRHRVPVYFYEAAAKLQERKRLEKVRRPGFDGHPPDIGDIAEHPTAGAVMVGARNFLIAYNINLTTPDAAIAKQIAANIRESSGGFRFVKAMGLHLPSHGRAQVSMNLTNFAAIPLDDLYAAVEAEAARLGTAIAESELIGFIPRAAFEQSPAFFRRIRGFNDSRIIEDRIGQLLQSN